MTRQTPPAGAGPAFPPPTPAYRTVEGVRLVRRADRGPAAAPDRTTVEEIESWLFDDAARQKDLLPLLESFVWRLVAAGIPLERATFHAGTLHPELVGFAWNWDRDDGGVDEVQVAERTLGSDAFRRNPLFVALVEGQRVRARPQQDRDRFPLMAELADRGFTDYIAQPFSTSAMRASGGDLVPLESRPRHSAMTLATRATDGFAEADLTALTRLLKIFALHMEKQIQLRIASNLLQVYLGADAGRRVLSGAIRRGAGERLPAVVWMSDLRGFTSLSERLAPRDLLSVLDAGFEACAGAAIAEGGEVLKFLGDGVLAVFLIDPADDGRAAAEAALRAATAAQAALDRLNAEPSPNLGAIEGWAPLRAGIALHAGDVFFGNVGAPERLDFTVIGSAVNTAARVEALCKPLGLRVLASEAVARRLPSHALVSLGAHALRGVKEPLEIFGLPEGGASD